MIWATGDAWGRGRNRIAPQYIRPMDRERIMHRYLDNQRKALLAKLDGVGERDVRWPMTRTGTTAYDLRRQLRKLRGVRRTPDLGASQRDPPRAKRAIKHDAHASPRNAGYT